MVLLTQVRALVEKNLLILVYRRVIATFLRALILPIVCIVVVSYLRLLFLPPSRYGFGTAQPIRNITRELFDQTGSRNRVVFINNSTRDEQVNAVIDRLSTQFSQANAQVSHAASEQDLRAVCPSSLLGRSNCYGAVIFQSSSQEASSTWTYTAVSDFNLGNSIYVDRTNNDPQIFSIPFIHAIDSAIADVSGLSFPHTMLERPFTSNTDEWYQDQVHERYMSAMAGSLAVICFIAVCGIMFHLTGYVATERELGMSQLIDVMLPSRNRWRSISVRLMSTHLSFFIIYLPGFIATGGILASRVFKHTSMGFLILYHILLCGSLTGFAHFCGSLFRYARLSGIVVVILSCVLAIIAQWALPITTTAVGILVVLLPPINFVSFIRYVATWEQDLTGAQLTGSLDDQFFPVPGWVYLVGCVVQIGLYPLLAMLAERWLYGIRAARGIKDDYNKDGALALRIQAVSKVYSSFLGRMFPLKKSNVDVLKDLTMSVGKGQIAALLGPNGCGKSTTMKSICGMESIQEGTIEVDRHGGIGLCPQKNVLWDDLTVKQHVRITYSLKSSSSSNRTQEVQTLIDDCDLKAKMNARASTLSGGQKRKLQLAMAFAGGSQFCCIDEASSGLDPVSRRKIWNILMAERGFRTILFTTHALDEADALSDQIYLLSRGNISLQGTAAGLKQLYGGGYTVRIPTAARGETRSLPGVSEAYHETFDGHDLFKFQEPGKIVSFLELLEKQAIFDYIVEGPSIEKAFLDHARAAKEAVASESIIMKHERLPAPSGDEMELTTFSRSNTDGDALLNANYKRPGFVSQVFLVFRKRVMVLRHTYPPLLFALAIPVVAAALLTLAFLRGFDRQDCARRGNSRQLSSINVFTLSDSLNVPLGPSDRISNATLENILGPYSSLAGNYLHAVDSFADFDLYLQNQYQRVLPGGLYLGENSSAIPTMVYLANGGLQYSAFAKGLFDAYLMNTSINTQVAYFAPASPTDMGNSFQMTTYFGLCMVVFPALFALYPSFERRSNVQALEISNGFLPGAIWLGHFVFDTLVSILVTIGCFLVFTLMTHVWYAPGNLAIVFLFYGLASTVYAYICAMIAKSPLGAFAIAAGSQAIIFLLYFLLYFVVVAFNPNLQAGLNTLQFTLGLVAPSGNLMRALLLGLNAQHILCRGEEFVSNPGDVTAYGGPTLYLVLQCFVYFSFLFIHGSGAMKGIIPHVLFHRRTHENAETEGGGEHIQNTDIRTEVHRTEGSNTDSLRVLHVNKTFSRRSPAVSDLTFGIEQSECFALLGPNGAGKTTTINMIRGNIKLDKSAKSDIIVCGHSMKSQRQAAIGALSVCPQFDAIDYLSVIQHLRFYGRAAGVPLHALEDVISNLLSSLELTLYKDRMASKLSGGNKRKLSLAIALIAQPRLLILDEPSSGMDALSMRMMWQTLNNIRKSQLATNMAILMTSHSMEEVSALSDRVGIMRKSMLAVGDKDELCSRYQSRYHVHLVLRSIPGQHERDDIVVWVKEAIPSSNIEKGPLHGQMRFSFPRTQHGQDDGSQTRREHAGSTLASVFKLLEANKEALGIEYYTVFQSTLENVFLKVVDMDED